ncbi:MAG TPA: hypothetical protein VHL09_14825 [Dehalococcoidia bacterium]|nr:hypothetical protein [Dehalococcoidia bacterium]
MAKQGFKVLDSDMHIIEPPNLWERYGHATFRDRMPYGLTEHRGDLRLAHEGRPWGRSQGPDQHHLKTRAGHNHQKNQERWKPYEDQGWSGRRSSKGWTSRASTRPSCIRRAASSP